MFIRLFSFRAGGSDMRGHPGRHGETAQPGSGATSGPQAGWLPTRVVVDGSGQPMLSR